MDLSNLDLDKMMMNQQAARRFSPPVPGRRFLRPVFLYARENAVRILLACLFLLGVLIGTLLVSHAGQDTLEVLKIVLGGYVERRQIQSFAAISASSFCSLFLSLLILFFCGFCTISQPIIIALPVFKGLGYGFSIGTLYAQKGAPAIQYAAVLLLPAMFFGAVLLIAACRASLRLSVTLFRSTVVSSEQNDRERIKRYCVKYIAYTVICLLISLLDATLFYQFSGLFRF